jgi:hypothetical protein
MPVNDRRGVKALGAVAERDGLNPVIFASAQFPGQGLSEASLFCLDTGHPTRTKGALTAAKPLSLHMNS